MITIQANGPLSFTNDLISIATKNTTHGVLRLHMYGDYALFNVEFICANNIKIAIWCNDENSHQFFKVSKTCGNNSISNMTIEDESVDVGNCIIHDSIETINNQTLPFLQIISGVLIEFETIYENECNDDNSDSVIFDIGYPLYATSIISSESGNTICCRGAESCAYTRAIYSNLGNIICSGDFSCGDSEYIWTGDDRQQETDSEVTIFCMGEESCFGASLKSANRIICGSNVACNFVSITSSQSLYCSYQSCNYAVLTQVKNIYIHGQQTGMEVYSGGIGIMTVDLYDNNAAIEFALTCSDEKDTCYINCGNNACSQETTTVTCYGKCFITCDGIVGNTDCVNIAVSMNPSQSPSNAPSNSPSVHPTESPTISPTTGPNAAMSLSMNSTMTRNGTTTWFNRVLFCILVIVVLIIIVGYVDAKKLRKNELFN